MTFQTPGGQPTRGVAEATEYGAIQRRNRMIVFIVVGFLAGTFCIIVPGPHMLGAWIPPVLGVWLGVRARSTRAKVFSASGPCPACEKETQWPGGSVTASPLEVPCPKCRAMVGVDLVATG